MYSKYNTCCFFCCYYDYNASKPWYQRNLCGRIAWTIFMIPVWICLIALLCAMTLILLTATGTSSASVLQISGTRCDVTETIHLKGFGECAARGGLVWVCLILCLTSVVFLFTPVYCYFNESFRIKIFVCTLPLCFGFVELLGVVATHLIGLPVMQANCNMNSYFGLMNVVCIFYGSGFCTAMLVTYGICWILYTYIIKAKAWYSNLKTIQTTYGSIPSDTDTV